MTGGSLGSSGRQYDMQNERDIIELLKMVRHSALDPETKDAVRDAVFSLSTETPVSLDELAMLVAPLGVSIAGASDPAEESDDDAAAPASAHDAKRASAPGTHTTSDSARNGFPQARPEPQFSTAHSTPTTAPSAAPADVTPPAPPTRSSDTTPKPTATPSPQPPKSAATEAASTPAVDSKPVPQPKADTAPAPEKTKPAADSPAAAATSPEQRIAEIKQDINARVGNPVNLIDATNETGREYMNALLEAMKATSGGGDVAPAMQRLEKAYAAVTTSLEADGATSAAPKSSAPKAAPAPEPKPAAQPEKPTQPQPAAPKANPDTKDTAQPDDAKTPASAPDAAETSTKSVGYQAAAAAADTSDTQTSAPASSDSKPTPVQPEPEPTTDTPADTASNPSALRSVATNRADAAMPTPPTPPEKPKSEDPLMEEVVTQGLHQLLREWNIFKAGGILRTGAKGVDHPLYQELQNLPMNLVIAGRFEGATPEVKQAIHDYMNGWRYELGMTHDLHETFEHYLRRVVKTIIDKQPTDQ